MGTTCKQMRFSDSGETAMFWRGAIRTINPLNRRKWDVNQIERVGIARSKFATTAHNIVGISLLAYGDSLLNRLQQGVAGVGVELDVDFGGHVVAEVEELTAAGDGHQ